MVDALSRRKPNRRPTGNPVLDSVVGELVQADAALTEAVVGRRVLHRGRYMSFETVDVMLESGRASRDIVVHPGAVVILALEPGGELLLVIQHRVPAGGTLLELPAGTLDIHDGVVEDELAAAHRELEEETGYRAGTMERLGGFWSTPGFSTEYMTLFLATDLRPAGEGKLGPDDDESLRLCRLHWKDALAAVEAGLVEDAKSVAGILWLARRLESEGRRG